MKNNENENNSIPGSKTRSNAPTTDQDPKNNPPEGQNHKQGGHNNLKSNDKSN